MPTYDLDSATNILAEVVDQDAFKVNNGESLELAAGGAIRATGTGGYGIQTVGRLIEDQRAFDPIFQNQTG